MARILIVDASPLIHATFNQVGHFSVQAGPNAGEPTGLRYGVLRSLNAYARDTRADKIAVCYDSKKVKKAEGVEHYKADRVWTEEKANMWSQVPALKEMLRLTRFSQVEAEGFEADDVVATMARRLAAQGHSAIIVTTDNDLCQVVNSKGNIHLWMPKKKSDKAYFKDEAWISHTFGVSKGLLPWRALVGDTSDNLPSAINPVSASKASITTILRHRHGLMTDAQLGSVDLYWEELQANNLDEEVNQATFRQNYDIMTLHDCKDQITITKGERNPEALRELFERLEFKSMMDKIPELTGG